MEMNRLTKKHKEKHTFVRYTETEKILHDYKIKIADENKIINKLGKLEDLEEELNIDLLELLEDFKKTKEELKEILNEHPEITPDYMAYTLSNGITYRKLSEELGCPLKVVFKALKEGIYCFDNDNEEFRKFYVPLCFNSSSKQFYWSGNNINYPDLKDYKKTWWLKSDKHE